MKSRNLCVLSFLLFLIFSNNVAAQKFGFGPKLGANYSLMKYKEVVLGRELQQISGFVGGVFAEVVIGKHFGIQPEFLYSQTGVNIVDGRTISGLNNRYHRFTYLSVPLELKYKFKGFGIYVGPQINFLVSAFDRTPSSATYGMTYDIKRNFKDKDVAVIAGFEYVLPFGLGFNFRYQRGLQNIVIPDGSLERSETQELFNDLVQFNILFRFGKHSKK